MKRKIEWTLVLFMAAVAAITELSKWLRSSLMQPVLAGVLTLVGILLIRLSSGEAPPPEGGVRAGSPEAVRSPSPAAQVDEDQA